MRPSGWGKPAIERLLARTKRVGECLEYQGCKNSNGYGWVKDSSGPALAHRIVWRHHHGDIQQGIFICHKCDNPCCVEISHLFTGTAKENSSDMVSKGRASIKSRGEGSGRAKITDVQSREIRRLRSTGMLLSEIAPRFGISESHASRICSAKRRTAIHGSVPVAIMQKDPALCSHADGCVREQYALGVCVMHYARERGRRHAIESGRNVITKGICKVCGTEFLGKAWAIKIRVYCGAACRMTAFQVSRGKP